MGAVRKDKATTVPTSKGSFFSLDSFAPQSPYDGGEASFEHHAQTTPFDFTGIQELRGRYFLAIFSLPAPKTELMAIFSHAGYGIA
jgi:hypothetical protein